MNVTLTAGFQRQLDEIEDFLRQAEAPRAFDALLDELLDTVIPNLERFPGLGWPLLDRVPTSVEAAQAVQRLRQHLQALAPQAELRESVLAHHLLLYARAPGEVYLLAIRHQRQLSLDFDGLWVQPG